MYRRAFVRSWRKVKLLSSVGREMGRLRGCGIGYRREHTAEILAAPSRVGWLEVLGDDFLAAADLSPLLVLRNILPMTVHTIGLNIGGEAPIDLEYCRQVQALAGTLDAQLVSDHLCWSHIGRSPHSDLLPVILSEAELYRIAARIDQVQEVFGHPIALENISRYLSFNASDLSDCQFLAELSAMTGCGVLLDINNLVVNDYNHSENARAAIAALAGSKISQVHLAGHTDYDDVKIDHHGSVVDAATWELFEYATRVFGGVPTSIEWDLDIPPLAELLKEKVKADAILQNAKYAGPAPLSCRSVEGWQFYAYDSPGYDQIGYRLLSHMISDEVPSEDFLHFSTAGVTSIELGYEMYKRNILLSAVNQAMCRYPLTVKILGPENLRYFLRERVRQCPGDLLDMEAFLDSMADFLVGRQELSGLPWLGDFLKLEQAYFSFTSGKEGTGILEVESNYSLKSILVGLLHDDTDAFEPPIQFKQVTKLENVDGEVFIS